jgi:hypothetical protein
MKTARPHFHLIRLFYNKTINLSLFQCENILSCISLTMNKYILYIMMHLTNPVELVHKSKIY